MSEYKVKIDSHKEKIGNDEYEVRTKDGKEQPITFKEFKKGESKADKKVPMEYRKKDGDKWPDKWESFDSEAEWNGGWVTNGIKLKNKDLVSGVSLKEELSVPMGFLGTPTVICWIGIGIIFAGIIALIWWWVASSNKEDKEEESL